MKWFWFLFLCCAVSTVNAQFLFKGQVSEDLYNKPVYLSLVEDYRKMSRVYLDQIIQKTLADSLGNFSFSGDQLPHKNRIYRIHADSCDENTANQNQFLRACSATQSFLFIANNRDTISVPLDNYDQAFCEIISTNPVSSSILEIEAMKEEMILDLIESESETAQTLNLDRWFMKFQEFGKNTGEPWVELYFYSFLSDRSSETHAHYVKDLSEAGYYTNLLSRLNDTYPNTPFTHQYRNELQSDQVLAEIMPKDPSSFLSQNWLYALAALAFIGLLLLFFRQSKKKSSNREIESLSPQEQKIYKAIKLGKTNKEIASELFISLSTVKTHINNIYKKLGITSRDEIL